MKSFFALPLIAVILLSGCGGADKSAESGQLPVGNASSPTEAYKMLFSAVKSKDPEKIKAMLSKATLVFSENRARQMNQKVEEIIRNGFSQPAMGDTMPQIRDEQVSDRLGMIEVYDAKSKMWQMHPFINEDGGWKLAVGEAFAGTWQPPGKTQTQREMDNSNMNPPQMAPGANVDWNNVRPTNVDPRGGGLIRRPNPTLGNVKPQQIPTH